jgi:hypothetical protein
MLDMKSNDDKHLIDEIYCLEIDDRDNPGQRIMWTDKSGNTIHAMSKEGLDKHMNEISGSFGWVTPNPKIIKYVRTD